MFDLMLGSFITILFIVTPLIFMPEFVRTLLCNELKEYSRMLSASSHQKLLRVRGLKSRFMKSTQLQTWGNCNSQS